MNAAEPFGVFLARRSLDAAGDVDSQGLSSVNIFGDILLAREAAGDEINFNRPA